MNASANVLVRCIDIGVFVVGWAVAALVGVCGVGRVPPGCWWGVQYW